MLLPYAVSANTLYKKHHVCFSLDMSTLKGDVQLQV